MPDNPNKLSQFWQELKRRRVVHVITVYAGATFVIIELINNITEPLRLPEWTPTLVIIILLIGFPLAVIFSWIYDITPEGVQKTAPQEEVQENRRQTSSQLKTWKITSYISIAVILGLVLFNLFNKDRKVNWEDLEKTIAVLPFENLGQEDLTDVLNNTLPIALITELQNIEGFSIKPWLSTKYYNNTEQRSSQIGDDLNVNFLIKGFLTPQGSDMEVDIWLIDAASEEVISTYNRKTETSDILQVRRYISRQVASLFNNNFNPDVNDLTANPDAELAYFTGLNYYWGDESKEDFQMAIHYFKRAIQLDPSFTMAYVLLSSSNSWIYHFYFDRSETRLAEARDSYEKAYDIDPVNPYILLAEGNYFYVTHQFEKSLELFSRAALSLSDNYELNIVFGGLHRRQGEMEEAIESFLLAEGISPQNKNVAWELAETNLLLRKYEIAEKYYQKYALLGGRSDGIVNEICLYLLWKDGTEKSLQALSARRNLMEGNNNPMLAHYKVRIALIDKKYDEALNALHTLPVDSIFNQFIFRPRTLYYAEIFREQNNLELASVYYDSARIFLENKISATENDHRYHSALGIVYAGLGRKEEAVREARTAINLMPVTKDYYRGIFCLEDLARTYIMVGDLGSASEILNQLLSMPSLISLKLLKKEPFWSPLWEYPGFIQMTELYDK
jgi:tetratricopeptide (TPR) repeat protein